MDIGDNDDAATDNISKAIVKIKNMYKLLANSHSMSHFCLSPSFFKCG